MNLSVIVRIHDAGSTPPPPFLPPVVGRRRGIKQGTTGCRFDFGGRLGPDFVDGGLGTNAGGQIAMRQGLAEFVEVVLADLPQRFEWLIPLNLPSQLIDAPLYIIKGLDPIIAATTGVVWVLE